MQKIDLGMRMLNLNAKMTRNKSIFVCGGLLPYGFLDRACDFLHGKNGKNNGWVWEGFRPLI